MPARTRTLIALALSALALAACGGEQPTVRERTGNFSVTLDDYLIRPQSIRVPGGVPLRVGVTNRGRLGHTFPDPQHEPQRPRPHDDRAG